MGDVCRLGEVAVKRVWVERICAGVVSLHLQPSVEYGLHVQRERPEIRQKTKT